MPIFSLLKGGDDFSQKFISLDGNQYETLEAAVEAKAAIITYGNLIDAIIHFIIVGFFLFLVLRTYERSKKKKELVAVVESPSQEQVLTEIRDELRYQKPI